MQVCVGIFLITSPIIVLTWLKEYLTKMKIHVDNSAVLTTCHFGTSKIFFSSSWTVGLFSRRNKPHFQGFSACAHIASEQK